MQAECIRKSFVHGLSAFGVQQHGQGVANDEYAGQLLLAWQYWCALRGALELTTCEIPVVAGLSEAISGTVHQLLRRCTSRLHTD